MIDFNVVTTVAWFGCRPIANDLRCSLVNLVRMHSYQIHGGRSGCLPTLPNSTLPFLRPVQLNLRAKGYLPALLQAVLSANRMEEYSVG